MTFRAKKYRVIFGKVPQWQDCLGQVVTEFGQVLAHSQETLHCSFVSWNWHFSYGDYFGRIGHSQVLLCILLQTPPPLHHHQRNLTVDCCLLALLFLLYMHERNDRRFHTYCVSCQTQGNVLNDDWDGCRYTKNTVALVEQKSDSHVWICS